MFVNIKSYFETFYTQSRISLENYYAEQIKIDCKMSSAKTAVDLYINFDQYLIKLKDTIAKLDKDVVDPINLFQQQISTIYLDSLNDLKQVADITTEQKKILDRQKYKFYESCKIVLDKETQLLRQYYNKKGYESEIELANDEILKYKSISENNLEQYKYEIIKFNSIIEEMDTKYKRLLNILKSNEESRIYFLKCQYDKFVKLFEGFNTNGISFVEV